MPNIEDLIQRAIQEGKFSDLPGQGKPLRLEDNPLADPEWQLAYHLLKENGFTLPWLELRQELENEIDAARLSFKRAWERRLSAAVNQPPIEKPPIDQPPQTTAELEAEFQRALRIFGEQIARINQRIFDYNLQTPADRFQMLKLNLEQEVKQICT
jgi:DnaJ family protein C protein 28